ncbi:hypothetical protein [Micrococcus sp. TA1]|uniref:hypothetical protein n=1 Tax=Micrococcus sp. TA1 TaxID=681627 RepID=UPI00161B9F5C|nr:hypothetical protein [Micrococcus sp. TA1]MBB5748528.1 hypothetical protein [Micrococcus sp. TA1]
MARYAYQEMIALDVDTMTVAAGVGQIYAESDVELVTPLTPVDDIGEPITLSANPRTGFLPTFYVDDHPSVRFVSGDLQRILVTTTPLFGPKGEPGDMGPSTPEAEAAAVAAQQAAAEAETLRVLAQQTAGKSAYQLAVDNGFVGTELQWLASLPGASGAQMIDNGTTVTFGP